ncbi:MAG: hypothetical protein ABFQ95_03925 [Pseudomonadota bacterium]
MTILQDNQWYKSFIDPDREWDPNNQPREKEQFPQVIGFERAKEKLEELCVALEKSPPSYSVISQTDPDGTIAMVTIEGVGSADAYEFKNVQKAAAWSMYHKLTGEDIPLGQAKKALAKLCVHKRYPEPQYFAFPGHYEVAVTVDDLRREASSYKSMERAEKEAAKQMYALLRLELAR